MAENDISTIMSIPTSVKAVIEVIYPVGAYYITESDKNPSETLGIGTWERVVDRTLLGGGGVREVGSEGGEETVTLTLDKIPAHTHSASTNTTGDHSHNRGTMDITGSFRTYDAGGRENGTGAFNDDYYSEWNLSDGSSVCWDKLESFKASRSWTGNTNTTGNHSHTVTVNNTGGSQAHNNLPPYRVVNIWRRTA